MAKDESDSGVPKELFTRATFNTLGGRVAVAGVVATVFCTIFGSDPKIVGLIVSIVVSYAALFMAKKRLPADYLVTGFNGFLVYFTLIGATAFYPYLNKNTAASVVSGQTNAPTSPFGPWVHDPNLVKASQKLMEVTGEQERTLSEVHSNFDVLEKQVQTLSIPAATKTEITRGLASNRNLILMTRTNNAARFTTLKALGIHQ
jgi:hypothetical protein